MRTKVLMFSTVLLIPLAGFGCTAENEPAQEAGPADTAQQTQQQQTDEAAQEQPAEQTARQEQESGPDCQEAGQTVASFYQENATDKMPGAVLSDGYIVASPRSYQGRDVFFVSFAVNGGEHIATWAQTSRDPGASMQVAVRDSYADELSVLGTMGSPPISRLSWPGAEETQECVSAALEGGS